MKEIEITVFPNSTVQITTKGFAGKSCKEATKSLEKALGGKVVSDTPTGEMYQQEKVTVKN